jgi:hypothetical protein
VIPVAAREQSGRSAQGRSSFWPDGSRPALPWLASYPICISHELRWDGASSSLAGRLCVQVWQAHACGLADCVNRHDIECAHPHLPNILASDCQNRAHPRPRQWPWLAAGGFASCPLLQRCSPNFLPLGCAHSSRDKKPRSAPSSTALRPCGCSGASPCL